MSGSPAFQFYPTDFLGDEKTVAMTVEEIGAYCLLLMISWQEEPVATLPNDDRRLAKWARVSLKRWQSMRDSVMDCFELKNDRWYQRRLREEHLKQVKLRVERRKAGRLGGVAKAKICQDFAKAKGVAKPASSIPSPTPSSIKNLSYKNHKKDITSRKRDSSLLSLAAEVIEFLNQTAGRNFSPKCEPTLRLISARRAEGRTFEDFKTVIEKKVAQWKDDSEMGIWIRPKTLFAAANFESYVNEPKFMSKKEVRLGEKAEKCLREMKTDPCSVQKMKVYEREECGYCGRARAVGAKRVPVADKD